MNLGEILKITREIAQDTSQYSNLWSDAFIIDAINEGQIEACRNGRLLKSNSKSLGETRAVSNITVSGTFGTISAINISNENIITNPITYTTNDNITAALLGNEINETGLFEATVTNNIIKLNPLPGNGSVYNNIVPIIVSTNTFATATPFAGGVDGICIIRLKNNVREYSFSNKIIKFEEWNLGESQKKLCLRDFSTLNEYERKMVQEKGDVEAILYGHSHNSIYVAKVPNKKDFINMTVYHLPLKQLKSINDVPEIPEHFHSKLVHYALYKMYQKSDIEAEQMDISNFHYSKFIEEFNDNQFSAASNQYTPFFFGV